MAKLYSKDLKKIKKLNPKQETVKFLLAYSSALRIVNYSNMKFEVFQN